MRPEGVANSLIIDVVGVSGELVLRTGAPTGSSIASTIATVATTTAAAMSLTQRFPDDGQDGGLDGDKDSFIRSDDDFTDRFAGFIGQSTPLADGHTQGLLYRQSCTGSGFAR